jgi:Rps23 Pro-64 3,4-dihydroxylase Tpa1-like proline 4-hydroxylase
VQVMLKGPIGAHVSNGIVEYARQFNAAKPCRHVIIDNFLDADFAQRVYEDLPDVSAMPKSHDYMFSDKRELSTLDRHSDISRQLHEVFMSPEFADWLSVFAGHTVFVDPEYIGGGFHAGAEGSFLDLHVDFNIHPVHQDWLREFNILLYLNPGWQPSWGGQLLLTDNPGSPTTSVDPLFNRLVIMESTDRSFHGYEKISFPPGRSRRSIAAYAYSLTPAGGIERRTTTWMPQNAGPVKRVLAKNWNWLVLTKNKFFGSGTLKNRR